MFVKYHSMEEKPTKSCEVILCSKWFSLTVLPFSYKYYAFGIRDTDDEADLETIKASTDVYVGWCYADELVWQMEVEHETQN